LSLRLVVQRHAKAPPLHGLPDHERPLDAEGRQQAAMVGAMLAIRGWVPDVVICSDATRARETWDRMEGAFERPVAVEITHALYTGGAAAALERLAGLPGSVGTALVLGHNPEWERLVAWLSGELVGLGTANAALLATPLSAWAEATAGERRFAFEALLRP
jgi:phosphohistidine phosphatase